MLLQFLENFRKLQTTSTFEHRSIYHVFLNKTTKGEHKLKQGAHKLELERGRGYYGYFQSIGLVVAL